MKRNVLVVLAVSALAACVEAGDGSGASTEAEPITQPAAAFQVGPEGGSFGVGGVVVEIPRGAVRESVVVTASEEKDAPEGFVIRGSLLRFAPQGLHFAVPITISFPLAAAEQGVFWTAEGSESAFEGLETTVENGRTVAHPSHFSAGFVGAPTTGVTCISKRRVIVGCDANVVCTCSQRTTIEPDVHFHAVTMPGSDGQDRGLATDSAGLQALYLSGPEFPIFHATDATLTKYVGYVPAREYILRTGRTIAVTESFSRGGSPMKGCESVPLIDVQCSGTTTLTGHTPTPPPPPPPPLDAGSKDAATDGDAGDASSGGVTCISKRRVIVSSDAGVFTCARTTTTEPNVHFYFVYGGGADPERALGSDSPGLLFLYDSTPSMAMFYATDPSNTRYHGYNVRTENILRSGKTIDVFESAARLGSYLKGCDSSPLIEVTCSGSTTIGR